MKIRELFEYQYGPDTSANKHPQMHKIGHVGGRGLPSNKKGRVKKGSWLVWNDRLGRHKQVVRKSGEHAVQTQDDEGNQRLTSLKGAPKTGKISFKQMHTETVSSAGPGASGASEPSMPQPEQLHDLDTPWETRSSQEIVKDIKTSKRKRTDLKKFLQRRTGETVRT